MRETALYFEGLALSRDEARRFKVAASLVAEVYDLARASSATPGVVKLNVVYLNDPLIAAPTADSNVPTGRDGDSVAVVRFPWRPVDMPPVEAREQLRAYLLGLLHEGASWYVLHRGWDVDPFDHAYEVAVAGGIRAEWAGSWKTARSSGYKARGRGEFTEEGAFAWMEVIDKSGATVARSDKERLGVSSILEVKRRCAAVRWVTGRDVLMSARSRAGFPGYADIALSVSDH